MASQQIPFPDIPGVTVPSYTKPTRMIDGKEEELPPLGQMPGHVLFGWSVPRAVYESGVSVRSDEGRGVYVLDKSTGHTAESTQPGKTLFPASWSDQQIVDAIRDAIEHGEIKKDGEKRVVEAEIHGVRLKVKWLVVQGQAVQPYGYPVYTDGSDGVTENRKLRVKS